MSKPIYKPRGDARYRVHRSEKIWVVSDGITPTGETIFGIQDSIERVIYTPKGDKNEYVQYDSHYYPLHSKSEFEEYRRLAINEDEIYFYSNYSLVSGDKEGIKKIISARFIFESEAGNHIYKGI